MPNGILAGMFSAKAEKNQTTSTPLNMVKALPRVPWLAAVLLVAALVVAGLAMHKLKTVVSAARTVVASKPVTYGLQRTPLALAEYEAILGWFQRLHPDVRFDVAKEGALTVFIKDGANHGDWLYALALLQSRDQDVVWESTSFCVGRCAGAVASAVLKGYRQKIQQD